MSSEQEEAEVGPGVLRNETSARGHCWKQARSAYRCRLLVVGFMIAAPPLDCGRTSGTIQRTFDVDRTKGWTDATGWRPVTLDLNGGGARIEPMLRGSETILLAEDEEPVRKLVRRILEGQGYTVLAASNGLEALSLASERPGEIDLLLTDVVMPVLGGPKLVERLRVERPGIRVLYMSGYTDRETDRGGVLEPGFVLVHKPFTRESLALAVRTALDNAAA